MHSHALHSPVWLGRRVQLWPRQVGGSDLPCGWGHLPARESAGRWIEVEAGLRWRIWSCFLCRFSLPPPLFTSPASFLREVGKCEEQQTAGSRWPCACQWGQWAQVPLSLCSQCDKDGPLHLCSSHPVPTVE